MSAAADTDIQATTATAASPTTTFDNDSVHAAALEAEAALNNNQINQASTLNSTHVNNDNDVDNDVANDNDNIDSTLLAVDAAATAAPSTATPTTTTTTATAESQVLEALTRLRSSSAGPTTPISSQPTSITCMGLIPNLNSSKDSNNKSTISWGCGKTFQSTNHLKSHLDDVKNKCIIPFTNYYLNSHPRDNLKSWQIVASAVENAFACSINSSNNSNNFDTTAIDPSIADTVDTVDTGDNVDAGDNVDPDHDNDDVYSDQSEQSENSENSDPSDPAAANYWGTVMENNLAAAVATAVSNSNQKISMSDLVEATLKVEAEDKANSRKATATALPGSISQSKSKSTRKKITKKSKQNEKPNSGPKRKRNNTDDNDNEINDSTNDENLIKITKKPKVFSCSYCLKQFTRKSNLDSHLITHSTARPHQCTQCGKPFARLSDRTRHEATTHGSTKTYQCRGSTKNLSNLNNQSIEWGCGHYYSRADGLRKHFKSAAGKLCLQSFLGHESNDINAQLQHVEAAIKNVRDHCGW